MKYAPEALRPKLSIVALAALLMCGAASVQAADSASNTAPDPDAKYFHDRYAAAQLAALVPKPRPEDVATPEALEKALHASVSGPKGAWDSNRFRSLFLPDAILAYPSNNQGAGVIQYARLKDLVDGLTQVHKMGSWYEKTEVITLEKYDRIAYVHSRGQSGVELNNPSGHVIEMGTMISDGSRWWFASYIWNDLPKKD
jgi:hypothetical protein